jgi:hypothetical protein
MASDNREQCPALGRSMAIHETLVCNLTIGTKIDIRHPPSRDLVPLKRTGYGGYGGRLSGSKGTAMCCRRITFQAILKVLGEDVHTGFH